MDFEHVLEFTEKHKKIVQHYEKVYIFVFKYFLFGLAFIVATIFTLNLASKSDITAYEEPEMISIRKIELKGQFEKFIEENTIDEDTEIHILQGLLTNSGEFFQSVNNLIEYKGFTMPMYVTVYKTAPIQSINYFNEVEYKLSELETFVKNVIFTRPIPMEALFKRSQLPIEKDLITTFNLSCLIKGKLFYGSCNHYIENFLENFYVYDIKKDYLGMREIYEYIDKDESYKQQFCDGIEKYVLYSNDLNPQLEAMFRSCGQIESFYVLNDFIALQAQFEEGYITDEIYYYDILNQYKLFSLQQMLYVDIASQRFNQRTLLAYVTFVQSLLKKDMLHGFYKDETYRFNTYYLKSKLRSSVYDNKREQVDVVINELNLINRGSDLISFSSLSSQITNNNIVLSNGSDSTALLENLPNISISELFNQVKAFSFFTLTQEKIEDSSMRIGGYIHLTHNNKDLDLYMLAKLSLWENTLLIDEIVFRNYPQLTISAQAISRQQNFTLPEMYQYVRENIGLYIIDSSDIDFCDHVNETIPKVVFIDCSPQYLEFTKKVGRERVLYKIILDNFNFEEILIDDKKIEGEVVTMLSGVETNAFNFYSRLEYIVATESKEEDSSLSYISDKSLIINENIKKYLGVTPDNIREKDEQFIIEFKLDYIPFVGVYSFETNTIEPIYFSNVYIREDKQLVVRNFNLVLDDDNKTSINNFITAPLDYIKEINNPAYEAYLKYK